MFEEELKDRIRGWYNNRGRNEVDPFYRFMCFWICLNAWLEYKSGLDRDREMIDWLKKPVNRSDLSSSYDNMAMTTAGRESLRALYSTSPIEDSRGRKPTVAIESEDDKENIIEAIYRIRCNLFHGGKESNNSRDIKLVNIANKILNKWISDLIAGWK